MRFFKIELERDGRRYEMRKEQRRYILSQEDGTETTFDSIAAVRRAIGSVDSDTRMFVRTADGTTLWETFL
jgi:hypothetical protein